MIFLNDVEIKPTLFPDKTSQVWKIDGYLMNAREHKITWKFESEAEFIQIAQLNDLISKENGPLAADLYMPYLPYARQDRCISNNETFALETFAELLNSMKFKSVSCYDPHSNKASDWIERFQPIYPDKEVWMAIGAVSADLVCYPDKGALSKYSSRIGHRFISAEKVRDPSSGEITSLTIRGSGVAQDQRVLIVDDICDGGATFIRLAHSLYEHGAKEVHLFVSHGIFSKGIQVLKDASIQRIFTKDGEIK